MKREVIKMEKKRKVLNNNAIGFLLGINILLLFIGIAVDNASEEDNTAVAHASSTLSSEEKRKNDDIESNEEYDVTFELESVAHFSEEIEGIDMFFSHTDENGAYFTYMQTESPKSFESGYWFVSYEVLEKGYYNADYLEHNDKLESIFIADANGDYMQLKPSSDTEKGYAYK